MKSQEQITDRISELEKISDKIRQQISNEVSDNILIRHLRNPRDTDFINGLITKLNECLLEKQSLEWVLDFK